MALKLTLMLAVEKGICRIQVLGDSLLVIKWMRREWDMKSFMLHPLWIEIQNFVFIYNFISFQHVLEKGTIEPLN